MAKKNFPYYASWDLNNIKWIAIISILILGFVAYFPVKRHIRANKLDSYKGEAIATIYEVVENKKFEQSYEGNKMVITSYKVSYTYNVNNAIINNTEYINPNDWIYHNKAISRDTSLIPFKVKYDLDNHWKSVLVLYDLSSKTR